MKKANTIFLICLLLLTADLICLDLSFPLFRESFSWLSGLILAIQTISIFSIIYLMFKVFLQIRKQNQGNEAEGSRTS